MCEREHLVGIHVVRVEYQHFGRTGRAPRPPMLDHVQRAGLDIV